MTTIGPCQDCGKISICNEVDEVLLCSNCGGSDSDLQKLKNDIIFLTELEELEKSDGSKMSVQKGR